MGDRAIAGRALSDEHEAIAEYGKQIKQSTSSSLKTVLRHNQGDEREHASRLGSWKSKGRKRALSRM